MSSWAVGIGLDEDQLKSLKTAVFFKDGMATSIVDGDYKDANAILTQGIQAQAKKRKERFALDIQAKQLRADMAQAQEMQRAGDNDGLITDEEYERGIQVANEAYGGAGRNTSNDAYYKRQTVDRNLTPVMREMLEEMKLDGSGSIAELERIGPPSTLYNEYFSFFQRFDNIRKSNPFKKFEADLRKRIIANVKTAPRMQAKFGETGSGTEQANWLINKFVQQGKQEFIKYSGLNEDPDLATTIGNRIITEARDYVTNDNNYADDADVSDSNKKKGKGNLPDHSFKGYLATIKASAAESPTGRALANIYQNWTDAGQDLNKLRKPETWVDTLGEEVLIQASKDLETKGFSAVLNRIAQDTGQTSYDIQKQLVEAKIIEPVEMIPTYAQLANDWSKEQRYAFTSDLASNQQKLRTLETQIKQLETSYTYKVRPSMQQSAAIDPTTLGQTKEWAALSAVISFAEGTGDGTPGYQTMFGGGSFTDMSRHPDIVNSSGRLRSAAAGRFQFMPATWAEAQQKLGLKDFGPLSQEMAGAYLTQKRGVDPNAVIKTKEEFADAMDKLSPEWAALPKRGGGSAYPEQRARKLDDLWTLYQQKLIQYGVQ